jgi:hypothetical protein
LGVTLMAVSLLMTSTAARPVAGLMEKTLATARLASEVPLTLARGSNVSGVSLKIENASVAGTVGVDAAPACRGQDVATRRERTLGGDAWAKAAQHAPHGSALDPNSAL